jgi:aryl carrier-like protein
LSFSVPEALAALEKAMQREHVQVSVLRLDWSRWRGLGVTGRVPPRMAHLCRDVGHTNAASQGSLPGCDTLRAAPAAERRGLLEVLIRDKVARVLGASPERLDGDRPLLQLGLDSLMAVELRNWIEGELRVNLPIVELMRSPSMSRLAEVLAALFDAEADAPPPGPGQVGAPVEQATTLTPVLSTLEAAPEALLERVGDLTGEQVDTLLATLLHGTTSGARQ